jgi:DNA uptake protein ComE-like DNA-binding protein
MTPAALVVSTNRRMRNTIAFQVLLVIALVAGCTAKSQPDDQQVRKEAAQTTAEVKQGAKQAGEQIKQGAATAERTLDDVAAGVKDGLKNSPPDDATGAVDINSATKARLMTLPGVGASEAEKIIRNRPYDRAHDLVKKGVMDEDAFAKVSSRVVVR